MLDTAHRGAPGSLVGYWRPFVLSGKVDAWTHGHGQAQPGMAECVRGAIFEPLH